MKESMRTLLRMSLPLALFVILILALCGISSTIFYAVFAAHVHGDYLRIETDYLDIDFPRNGFVSSGDMKKFSGIIHSTAIYPPNTRASMIIRIFDENAAKGYLREKEIDDAFSANLVELKGLYDWVLVRNENATLSFVENGTMKIFEYDVDFTTIIIGGYVDNLGDHYNNCTWTFVSFIGDKKIIQIFYFGIEKDYEITRNIFQDMLDTKIRLKEEEQK